MTQITAMQIKEKETIVVLEKDVPFSQCKLWQLQREFFAQAGIQAWVDQVPFYITSNPYIAYSYANIIIRFMQDCSKQELYQKGTPFYIVELGAGHGMFSFYILKHLLELQQTLQLTHLNFVYVMTDFNEQMIPYWEQHPALQKFIQEGMLDFARYDAEHDDVIQLHRANKTLAKSALPANPMIVIANYVFDSIVHDVFQIAEGQLQEGLATLTIPSEKFIDGKPQRLDAVKVHFNYRPANNQYYPESAFNDVLNYYVQQYKQGYFTFSIASLRCIDRLRELTGNNVLLLATDKGYADTIEDYLLIESSVVFHSSFSMMVNFDAIRRYVRKCGGDCHFQTAEQQNIETAAFIFGQSFANLPETRQTLKDHLDHYSPGHLFKIQELIKSDKLSDNYLYTILANLGITHWDPYFFNNCLVSIVRCIPHSNKMVRQGLQISLPRIAENYYYLPAGDNTLFNIGAVYQKLENFAEALRFYQLSTNYFEPTEITYFNMGLCYYGLQQYETAVNMFSHVIKKNPDHILACGWLAHSISKMKSPDGPTNSVV